MLYREMIAVCSEVHTEHINALCEQNVEFFNGKSLVNKIISTVSTVNKSYFLMPVSPIRESTRYQCNKYPKIPRDFL
jgi:hypothetical protein